MDQRRFQYEQALMEKYFPRKHQWVNMDDPQNAFLDFAHTSASGRSYNLKIVIPPDYPNSLSQVFVMYPKPDKFVDHRGKPLYQYGPDHNMHLLHPNGKFAQLCHFLKDDWHPNCSLYLVAVKCALWLEVYEQHLATGQPIDTFVSS